MAHRDEVGDRQLPYINDYKWKALLAALKELYKEPPKPTSIIFALTINDYLLLLILKQQIDYSQVANNT